MEIAFPTLKTEIPPRRLLQGVVSYAVAAAALFTVVIIVMGLARSILSSDTALRAQSEKLSTLSAALAEEKALLAASLYNIGADPAEGLQGVSSERTVERLNNDTEQLVTAAQDLGLALERRAPYSETPFSAKLSTYQLALTLTGNAGAMAAFLHNGVEGDARISTLTVNNINPLAEQKTLTLNMTLTRIGAATTLQTDALASGASGSGSDGE